MAFVARMAIAPRSLPAWYPAPDPADPAAYPLRFQWLRTVAYLLVEMGVLEEGTLESGAVLSPADCSAIAAAMRQFFAGVPPEVTELLRAYWDALQAALRAEVERRGEIAVAGFEPFPYDAASLRNDLVHFGAFNAIAAEHGGYRLA